MCSLEAIWHHSDTSSVRLDKREVVETYYRHGLSDILNVVFYGMVWIIIHALLQEYIWEVCVSGVIWLCGVW